MKSLARRNGTPPAPGSVASVIEAALAPRPKETPFWHQERQVVVALNREQAEASKIMEQVMVLLQFRAFQHAIGPLVRACQLWPTNAEIQYHTGCVLLELGQLPAAIQKFDV